MTYVTRRGGNNSMRNDLDRFLKNLVMRFILLILTGVVITLPFWNPYQMNLGGKIVWWVLFGGAMVYIWVQSFRRD